MKRLGIAPCIALPMEPQPRRRATARSWNVSSVCIRILSMPRQTKHVTRDRLLGSTSALTYEGGSRRMPEMDFVSQGSPRKVTLGR